jgi:hypothetical protein
VSVRATTVEARTGDGAATTHATRWARPSVPRVGLHHVVLVLLVVQFAVIALVEASRDSATVDEAVDVASGITTVVRRDFRMNPEHGPLPKVLSALPALVARPIVPDDDTYRSGAWFDYTDRFIAENRAAGRLDDVLFLARTVAIAQGLAVALLLYVFGRRLAGHWGGTLAAALWLTAPVAIGFSHFAMIDIAFTLALLTLSYVFLRFLDGPSFARSAWCGAAGGAAMLTRHNALLIVAAVAVACAVATRREPRHAARHAAIVGAVSLAVVWAFYRGLDPTPPNGEIAQRFDGIIATAQSDSAVARGALVAPMPHEFRAGLAYLFVTSDERPAYLFGQSWDGARVWFFPASAVAKLSFVTITACLIGLFGMRRVATVPRRRALVAVWLPAGALALILLAQPLNLGLRYAFPIVAALFACAAPAVLLGRVAVRRATAILALAVQVWFVWSAAPHSLAWTPPPFTPAYRFVTDSNVDYGQDVERFLGWAANRDVAAAIVRARGFDLPPSVRPLADAPVATLQGWVAVSVTNLTALDRDELSWLRAYCPVGTIGGTILLYHFDAPPDLRAGPTMPVASCFGDANSRRA